MLHGIWLVSELGRDILPTNIFTKFDDYTMKTIEVIEWTNALHRLSFDLTLNNNGSLIHEQTDCKKCMLNTYTQANKQIQHIQLHKNSINIVKILKSN